MNHDILRGPLTVTALLMALALFSLALPAQSRSSEPFTVHHMLAMKRVSSSVLSPDQKQIALVLRETDLEANKGRTDIWLVPAAGGVPRQITQDPASDHSPAWAPDGSGIYFLSSRKGGSQIWFHDLSTGEESQITDLPLPVGTFKLDPKGKTLLLSMEVYPGLSLKETTDKIRKEAECKTSGRIYDTLFFRHWDTWGNGMRSHLFALPIGSQEPRDLMPLMDADCPSKPFGGAEEYTFNPTGDKVVFTARNEGRTEAWSTNFDLYEVLLDSPAPPTNLTGENKAWDTTPVFSPCGKTLAYLAMKRPGFEADRFGIMLRDCATGKTRELAPDFDRSAGTLIWSPDGKTLYTHADDLGNKSIFAIDIKTGKQTRLVSLGTADLFAVTKREIFYNLDHLQSPTEIFAATSKGTKARQISFFNKEILASCRMGVPEQFTFKGWNDETVHAWLVKPADFQEGQKYPVAFLIHGGPQGSFGNHFHYRWNPQTYCGRGYAAIMVDFHGSTGYGQAFTDAISGDWGGKPLEDLQKGLAAAVERYPFLDGSRVGALGASYGGYMINWIAGNWPDRFRCLVCHDGNLDEQFAYYDTEELWFPEWEHKGTPWENPEHYQKHNPVNFVSKWKTPMLVIHGGQDFRVVETQGMATFTALQRRGIPSRFLYFPDENHWVLKPHNSILWHDTVLDWLDQWVKKP